MSIGRLEQTLAPHYRSLDAAHRADHAKRIAKWALEWAGDETDRELVEVLAHILPLGELAGQRAVRGAIESCLVEQGWTNLRVRQLFHALERMPKTPKSDEEKLVADADCLEQLGIIGFARHIASASQSLEEALESGHKALGRRLHTSAAYAAAAPLREELRDLLARLRKALS